MKNVKLLLLVLITGALLAACSATSEPAEPTEVPTEAPTAPPTNTPGPYRPEKETIKNIDYVDDPGLSQRLDLYLPAAATKEDTVPVVMMIHQGGAEKSQSALTSLASLMVDQGFAAISINHREAPAYPFPANVSDGICALGWIYKNAEQYGFDVDHIFLLGYSSGASIVSFMGSVDSYDAYTGDCMGAIPEDASLAGVITFTGIFDYTVLADNPVLANYIADVMGGSYAEVPEVWEEASAIKWVDGSEPEFLLLHGENDTSVPPAQSTAFYEKLEEMGGTGRLYIMPGLGHMSLIKDASAIEILQEFLLEKTAP